MRNMLDLLGFTRKASLSSPDMAIMEALGAIRPTAAGISVSRQSALRCPAVVAAVRAISDPIGTLPLRLVRTGADGSRQPVTDHPVASLLASDWCGWLSSQESRRQVTADALLEDIGGVAMVTRVRREPREIIRLPPGSVSVVWSAIGEPTWTLTDGAGSRVIPPADVIHIASPFSLPPDPRSPLSLCREAVALAIVMEGHAGKLFGQGARPSGVLSFTDKLDADATKRVREAWALAHGPGKSGNTAILDRGATFLPLALNSVDAQFLELRTFAVDEIARGFGVPPHRLYELGRATWSNVTDMGREFVDYSLAPWLRAWESALARALLTAEERATFSIEFDTDDLTLPSLGDQAEAFSKLITARVANPNEVRAWMSLPPYEGGDVFANPHTTVGGTPDVAHPTSQEAMP